MADTLTEEELARCRDAFASFDPTSVGTIRAEDVVKVMERLGETLSDDDHRLLVHPEVAHSKLTFDDFLVYIVGPPSWETIRPDPEKELNEAIAVFDDGSGYVALRDLIRMVRQHIGKSGAHLTDDDLINVCREAFDGSWSPTVGDSSAPESILKVLEEEFPSLCKGQKKKENGDSGRRRYGSGVRRVLSHCRRLLHFPRFRRGIPAKAGVGNDRKSLASAAVGDGVGGGDGGSAGGTAHMISLTVVDLGGNTLMCDAIASKWTVQDLQQYIETAVGVPVHRQCLFLVGDDGCKHGVSSNDASLSKAGFVDGSTVLLAVKEEVKLDYKSFVARVMDVEADNLLLHIQNSVRRA